jgi:hypothetical protein
MDMTHKEFIDWRKTQLISYHQHHQSKECIDVEPLKAISIPKKDGKFSFQCSCGAIHQFQSTENKEEVLLEVKLS